MQRTIPESTREHADLALAVYVEELAARRRVLFVGDAASAVPERLSSVARSVEVVSPRSRARGTRRGGRILPRPWPSPQDAHSWDLVLVPDLLWAGAPAPERIAEMAEWLTPRGVLVAGAEERDDGVDYESLYALLSERFDWVRMLGQAPFSGWSVVDFAPASNEVEITFDGSLLGGAGEEPARFLALCAAREVVLDPYAIVQVPFARHDDAQRAGPRGDAAHRELSTVRARAEQAERRLEQVEREIAKDARTLSEARAEVERLARDLAEARKELSLLREPPPDEDHARLESALAERARELIELRHEIERRGVLVRDLVEELTELRRTANEAGSSPPTSAPQGESSAENWPEMVARARERAVSAEAAVAETGFRLDQLRGELALCTKKRESEREDAAREIAFAQGTARGLASRLAEAEEMRRAAEGRLALADDDFAAARLRAAGLEREVEETRDQLKHALVRVHGAPSDDAIRTLEERVAAMANEIAERNARIEALSAESGRAVEVEVESRNLARQLEHAEKELEVLRHGHEGELREKDARHGSELARLRGERDGLRLRLEDAEIAIASMRTRPVVQDGSSTAAVDELRHRVEELGARLSSAKAQADEANAAREKEAIRAGELANRLTIRDTMIGRLKNEMANFVVNRDDLARQVKELETTITELRESVDSARRFAEGQAESERRHARELENRVSEVERAREREVEQHGATRRTLAEAREILSQLASGFDTDEERPTEFAASTSELGRQLRRAEARALELESELDRLRASDSRPERDAELRRTQQLLSDRDAQLMALEERITEGERGARAMREVFAESRAGLESLLSEIANDQRAEAADRIASMLRSLRRY
jgi:chromosome segregation ATPase